MERTVTLRDRQEQQAADHNNLQLFARDSFDDLISGAIHDGNAYVGFDVAQTGTTEVSVQPGELYSSGAVHIRRDVTTKNLFEYLPVATKKKVALVSWATSVELDVQPRDFLINVDTGETEPQAVSMEQRRQADINTIAGVESPDPQAPVVDDNLLTFCIVTLNTTGIEKIEMVDANRLPRLKDVSESLTALTAWKSQTEPRISTIASDITSLANSIDGTASVRDMFSLFADMARLKELNELPDDYADYGADRYLNDDETDSANVNLLAHTEEGVRFSAENEGLSELGVFSTLDPNQVISNGLMLPKYDNITRLNINAYSGETSISQYGYQTHAVVQRQMSRQRIRYGTTYTYCTNSSWWRSGAYDPVSNIFTRNGETFEVTSGDVNNRNNYLRLRQFWMDSYEDPYWEIVTTDHTINGAQVSQTFLNAQDGWLTELGFYLTRRAGSGNVHLTICETVSGAPDPSKAIMHMTVDYTDLNIYPTKTLVPIPPTYLQAGKRYALIITTNADHWLAMASGNAYAQGTFFYNTDGDFYQGDLTKDMMLELRFASFRHPRIVIDMQPLNLDGGISDIDINSDMIVPNATELVFEVQANNAWIPLSSINTQALIGLPPLIPLRAVFIGTSDIMPGLKLLGSQVRVSRPRTSFKHISTPRLLAATSTQIRLQLRLESWNGANHTVAAKLLVGAGYATEETPDITEDEVINAYATLRTMTFNLAAPTDDFKIQIEGTTSSALDVFHVAERVDVAF